MSERLEGRNGDIWKWYCAGMTQEAIAEKYAINQSTVSRVIAEVRELIPAADKDEYRRQHLETAARMRAELTKLTEMAPIPAYSNGRPILMEDGVTVAEDHSGRLAAMDRLTKWLERESKLLGLDAPTKLEASVALTEQEAATALAAEAAARMAERGGDE